MPKKNALIVQAVLAFAEGCGGAGVDHDACEWFFERYYPWIDGKKGNGKSPQDVWDTYGQAFREKFKAIGKNAAASGGGTVNKDTLQTEALAVERDSDCPYCP
jgi:hypothetical protein